LILSYFTVFLGCTHAHELHFALDCFTQSWASDLQDIESTYKKYGRPGLDRKTADEKIQAIENMAESEEEDDQEGLNSDGEEVEKPGAKRKHAAEAPGSSKGARQVKGLLYERTYSVAREHIL